MSAFTLLEQKDEDELHKTRLLNVDEKPFKRLTKRLLAPGSLVSLPAKLPTPPPDGSETTVDKDATTQEEIERRRQFHDDILLDFAAFDSSIVRIQFLRDSNERERERYAAEKVRILEAAQKVRDNTAELRVQLESARETLNQRKKFDELAEKITSNKLLRPRADQKINLLKLEEECRELEKESHAYAETWKERREQFGRIVEEGMQLRRLIRDEKEEVERREGMDIEEDGEVGDSASRGGATPRHNSHGGGTPRPHSGHGNETPLHGEGQDEGGRDGLKVRPHHFGSISTAGSRAGSRVASPHASDRRMESDGQGDGATATQKEGEADVNMADSPLSEGEAVDSPREGAEDTREPDDGDERMDTT